MHAISGCKSVFILTSVLPACPHAERHVSVSAHMFPVGLPPPMRRRAQKHVPAAPVPYVGARASKIRYFTWYESAGRQEQARRDSETLCMPAGDERKWGDRWRECSTTFFEITRTHQRNWQPRRRLLSSAASFGAALSESADRARHIHEPKHRQHPWDTPRAAHRGEQ